jgi:hypothetical protein
VVSRRVCVALEVVGLELSGPVSATKLHPKSVLKLRELRFEKSCTDLLTAEDRL